MANFQFGQQNVGSNWDVPSWYVQSMGQSPMAASIAGIGNSIAAFASGYQAAKQAERGYGLDERRVKAQEKQIEQQGSYYESLNKQRQQAGNEDQVIGNWLSGVGDEVSRYHEWVKAGRPSANAPSFKDTSAMVPATQQQQLRETHSALPSGFFGSGAISADVLSGVPSNPEMTLFPQQY